MVEREMFLVGDESGEVYIQCRRRGCMVPREPHGLGALNPSRMVWLEITIPYDATPRDVDRIWAEHRLAHANKER